MSSQTRGIRCWRQPDASPPPSYTHLLAYSCLQASTVIGTPYNLSPEVCQNRGYDARSDLWALGCVLYELCSLSHAFEADSLLGLVHEIVHREPRPLPSHYSDGLRDLVARLLAKDPSLRPSAAEVLALPVIAARVESISAREGWVLPESSPRMVRVPTAAPEMVRDREGGACAWGICSEPLRPPRRACRWTLPQWGLGEPRRPATHLRRTPPLVALLLLVLLSPVEARRGMAPPKRSSLGTASTRRTTTRRRKWPSSQTLTCPRA